MSINECLAESFGVKHDWERVIIKVAHNRASRFQGNGIMDDIVADITSELVIKAKSEGGFKDSLQKARENSSTPEELVANTEKVVRTAAWYRVTHKMKRHLNGDVQFSQIGNSNADDDFSDSIPGASSELDYDMLRDALIAELNKVSESPIDARLQRRYKMAAEIVPDRLSGMTFDQLIEKYHIKSRSTLQAILEDIQRVTLSIL